MAATAKTELGATQHAFMMQSTQHAVRDILCGLRASDALRAKGLV